jgi:eukaryotic-like serine/threonine-protein kinase
VSLGSGAIGGTRDRLQIEGLIAGRFRLRRRLGRGGMSDVWLARDCRLGRPVAMKIRGPDGDPIVFRCEARSLASLHHPNVAVLYDYAEFDGISFLIIEYLPGGTLHDRLARRVPMSDAFASHVACEVAAGLSHVHERGMVHRDLKPSNLVFDADERVKLADFGIAVQHGQDSPTGVGAVVGTAAYISPEQATGRSAGPASDVYSFGVVLFQMLTGELPFDNACPRELLRLHVLSDAPPVRSRRPDAPATLAAIADSALARDAGARPPDGAAILRTLRQSGSRRVRRVARRRLIRLSLRGRRPWL